MTGARESARLASALLCLLSPFDSPWTDAWPVEVARELRSLVGGDKAVVAIEMHGATHMYGDGVPSEVTDAYTSHYARLDLGMALQRATGIEVWSRCVLWKKDVLDRSEYYNDFACQHGLHDTVGLAVVRPLLGMRACLAVFHHDPVRSPRVTQHQLGLLDPVLPAFKAGATLWAFARRSLSPRGPAENATHDPVVSGEELAAHSYSALRARYRLTDREAQVAQLLATRRTNVEIAGALGVSPHTARHHTESVLLKIGVRSRAAVEQAIR